jgi:hypothetical protein
MDMSPSEKDAALHDPGEVTREWLERALGKPVQDFETVPQSSTWGNQLRIRARVGSEARPRALRVKIGSSAVFGRSEVDYYARDFVGLADAPLVRCHHAAADATHYHLLLDDHAETHRDQFDVPPTEGYGRRLAEHAARLHAYHWPQPAPGAEALERSIAEALSGGAALIAAMREGFTHEERRCVESLLVSLPAALRARLAEPRGFTWVHGDLNPGNVLAPIGGEGPLYLIDHQPFTDSLRTWLGVGDLAYAIVLWWPAELRRMHERALVEHWHAALEARGVRGYPMGLLWQDWELCGLRQLLVPADWCSKPEGVGGMRWLWEPQLRRVLAFAADRDAVP